MIRIKRVDWSGIIPACAGSTKKPIHILLNTGDHPRMCGEHIKQLIAGFSEQGSSPHVRGALERVHACGGLRGIIPACAGSTTLSSFHTTCIGDHPRMCGEHTSKTA